MSESSLSKKDVLNDINIIKQAKNDLGEIIKLSENIHWGNAYVFFKVAVFSTFVIMCFVFMEIVLAGVFESFQSFANTNAWKVMCFSMMTFSALAVLIHHQIEKQRELAKLEDNLKVLNKRYGVHLIANFDIRTVFRNKVLISLKNKFANDTDKVDFALNMLKNEDEDFMKNANLILDLTEKMTLARKNRQKIRLEASSRLGESVEEQEALKITEGEAV